MLKRYKYPLIAFAGLFSYWFLVTGNEDAPHKYKYTIEHYNEDGCEIYREIADLAAKRRDYKKALKFYEKSLDYKPDNVTTYDHLGRLHEQHGNIDAALKAYFKAVSITPNFIEERFRKDAYISQEANPDFEILQNKPAWTNQELTDKTILVYAQRALSDTLHFARFIPLLKKLGATVLFKPQKPLCSLFQESLFPAKIICEPLDEVTFDYHVSLLSLPHLLDIGLDQCLQQNNYISVQKNRVDAIQGFFNKDVINIGIVWQGNPHHMKDKNRSLPLSYFYNLCRLPNVQIYSLQKGAGLDQLEDVPYDITIVNLHEHINDFVDTAAFIEQLDLVISVDTAVAHLAGALGKETWMLTPQTTDWRWLGDYEKDRSLWYKNLKKFRQDRPGMWQSAFNKIVALVRQRANVVCKFA